MKTFNPKYVIAAFTFAFLISCNDKSNVGNTTSEGTTLEDQRPHQNGSMTGGGIEDTITSPGSNATDIEQGTDPNMQNQSGTHGTNTQSGDNGTGAGSAAPSK